VQSDLVFLSLHSMMLNSQYIILFLLYLLQYIVNLSFFGYNFVYVCSCLLLFSFQFIHVMDMENTFVFASFVTCFHTVVIHCVP